MGEVFGFNAAQSPPASQHFTPQQQQQQQQQVRPQPPPRFGLEHLQHQTCQQHHASPKLAAAACMHSDQSQHTRLAMPLGVGPDDHSVAPPQV